MSLFVKEDLKDIDTDSLPGEYPFLRGIHKTMYKGKLWTMRQYSGFGDAFSSNKRYLDLLKKGSTGLSVAFDLPTQMGYDSDHIMSTGEVGRVGVSIDTIEDMEILFDKVPIESISTSMTINATAAILLSFYIAMARRRKVDLKLLKGTIQNDILKEYIARGTYIYPPKPSLKIVTDIFKFSKEIPSFNTISVSGYHIREAGSTASQEVAFTIANAITYVEAAIKSGLSVEDFVKRISFFFNVHNDFFEEVSKFRAARVLWSQVLREDFGVKDDSLCKLRFHSQTAGSTLTSAQPLNNIARVALQAMASVLGGTQSLHTNSMDEALGLPTNLAATTALRTQQIIAHETKVSEFVDPLGGSYLVESLTARILKEAKDYIKRIKNMGGVVKCIETGWLQNEIQNESFKTQLELESKKLIQVGVNQFVEDAKENFKALKLDEDVCKRQIQRTLEVKKKRDVKEVNKQIQKIKNTADSGENLIPVFIEAVESGITLGEISDALRSVFGRHKETITI